MFHTINWIDIKTKAHESSSINEIPTYGWKIFQINYCQYSFTRKMK
jgi:hypothetical protein